MAMVYKVCGRGEGVGGDGLGIVINLCLVWNKEISSHTNRRRLFVTPFVRQLGQMCVWMIDDNILLEELEIGLGMH